MFKSEVFEEFRRLSDAAEAVAIVNGLGLVLKAGVVTGEVSADVLEEFEATALEVYVQAGSPDPAVLLRKAKRCRDAVLVANLPFVHRIARRTLGARRSNPANLEEAVSEGSIGLMRALDEFDPARGSFTTCAAFWIRHHVQNCMHRQVDFAKQRSACMPPSVAKACNVFRLQHGREPQPHEVTFKDKPCTPKQWRKWLDAATTFSLDAMLDGTSDHDEHGGWRDAILADGETSPDNTIASSDLRERLLHAMHELSPRNQEMTRMLLIDGESLETVAVHFGISTTRVHQLRTSLEKHLRKTLKRKTARAA